MPVRPPIFRPRSGRGSTADRQAAERARDRRRLAESATRRLYKTARWRVIRTHQLLVSPVCVLCEAEGRTTVATICDHETPHRGDPDKFWDGPFLSLCKPCHDRVKQREEQEAWKEGSGGENP